MFTPSFNVIDFKNWVNNVKKNRIMITTGEELSAMLGEINIPRISNLHSLNKELLENFSYFSLCLMEDSDEIACIIDTFTCGNEFNLYCDFWDKYTETNFLLTPEYTSLYDELFSKIDIPIVLNFLFILDSIALDLVYLSDNCMCFDELYTIKDCTILPNMRFSKYGSIISNPHIFPNILYGILPKTEKALRLTEYLINGNSYSYGKPTLSEILQMWNNEGNLITYIDSNGNIVK